MKSFISKYAYRRRRIWPEVAHFFRSLPSSVSELQEAFATRLVRETSPTGHFDNVLEEPSVARIFYLPIWSIQSYRRRGIDIENEEELETGLVVSAFLGFCAVVIQDDLIDEDKSDVRIDELLLAHLFHLESVRRLHRLFPSASPFWGYHNQSWHEYTQAVWEEKQRDRFGLTPFCESVLKRIGNKSSPLKAYPLAVALKADQKEDIDTVIEMMDDFNTGVQLHNDLSSLKRDLESRHYTAPITDAALAAGDEVGTHPSIDGLYGALITTDAVIRNHDRARHYYERARKKSMELGMGDLAQCLSWYLERLAVSREKWRRLCLVGVQ